LVQGLILTAPISSHRNHSQLPPKDAVEKIPTAANFKRREAAEPKVAKREPRMYRTGRTARFNIKADPEIVESSTGSPKDRAGFWAKDWSALTLLS
jgi:hypothetical protein